MPERKTRKTARPGTAERPVDRGARKEPAGWYAPLPEPKVVREARFEFRCTAYQKDLIEFAAALRGQTAAEYVRTTVVESAKTVVREAYSVTLTLRDWQLLSHALRISGVPAEEVSAVLNRYDDQAESLKQILDRDSSD